MSFYSFFFYAYIISSSFLRTAKAAKCRDATITCHMFREWDVNFIPIVIFEDQEKVNRKVLSRLTDIVDKQFSTLSSAKEELPVYLDKYL